MQNTSIINAHENYTSYFVIRIQIPKAKSIASELYKSEDTAEPPTSAEMGSMSFRTGVS